MNENLSENKETEFETTITLKFIEYSQLAYEEIQSSTTEKLKKDRLYLLSQKMNKNDRELRDRFEANVCRMHFNSNAFLMLANANEPKNVLDYCYMFGVALTNTNFGIGTPYAWSDLRAGIAVGLIGDIGNDIGNGNQDNIFELQKRNDNNNIKDCDIKICCWINSIFSTVKKYDMVCCTGLIDRWSFPGNTLIYLQSKESSHIFEAENMFRSTIFLFVLEGRVEVSSKQYQERVFVHPEYGMMISKDAKNVDIEMEKHTKMIVGGYRYYHCGLKGKQSKLFEAFLNSN